MADKTKAEPEPAPEPEPLTVAARGPPDSHRTKVAKTAVLIISFLGNGCMIASCGPTLLDMKDLLGVSVEMMSWVFLATSLGNFCGSITVGLLMDSIKRFSYLSLFLISVLMSLSTAYYPHAPNLLIFFATLAIQNFTAAAIFTMGNVLCLDVWQGRPRVAGPAMHGVHFAHSLGSFLAPVLARPFLREVREPEAAPREAKSGNGTRLEGATRVQDNDEGRRISLEDTEIDIYFLVLGSFVFLTAIGYLLFHFRSNHGQGYQVARTGEEKDSPGNVPLSQGGQNRENGAPVPRPAPPSADKIVGPARLLLLTCMCGFIMSVFGTFFCTGLYIAYFAVESQLGMTRQDGSTLTAIYFGTVAAVRLIVVFVAIKVRPIQILSFNFVVCLGAGLFLALQSQHSVLALQLGTALAGVGISSMFSTGMVWIKEYIKVTNRISSLFTISVSVGIFVLNIAIGQLISVDPMNLWYCHLTGVSAATLLFSMAFAITRCALK